MTPDALPGDVEALQERGRAAYEARRFDEALACFEYAISQFPSDARAHTGLGAVLHRIGRLSQARTVLEQALELDPDAAAGHDNLGVVLRLLGQREKAIEHHRRAISLRPDAARAHANLGLAFEQTGDHDGAQAAYLKAIRLDASLAAPHSGLGRIHAARGDYEEAEAAFRAALAIDRDYVSALTGLGGVLQHRGDHRASLRLHRHAVRRAPYRIDVQLALGLALSAAHRDHQALSLYRRLERAGVTGPSLWLGKAGALANVGRVRSADRLYRRAFAQVPDSPLRSAHLFMLHAAVLNSPRAMLRELRQWEPNLGAPAALRRTRHERGRDPDRPLRIGYLSPDFRLHVVRQFFEPVLTHHDDRNVEIHCYAEVERPDIATRSVRWFADRWYRTWGRTDAEVAERIDRDRIDVLVDLAGHSAHNRLGVMTYRPAPVQATHLGYFGSTGLSTIDYWITDEMLHPHDTPEPATEVIWRLPRIAFCYGVPAHAPNIQRSPDATGPVVFGCFNNITKVGRVVVDAWAEILRRCPDARLVLKGPRFDLGSVRRIWRQRFARRGIATDRVDLLPSSPHLEYMHAYNEIDVVLDPFPRTGGTTTCDALWMGVPVVTLAGRRYVERLSATKLAAVGVPELITTDIDSYVDMACTLASEPHRRAEYHATLRPMMARSPLCDPASLASTLEQAYREMWRRYLAATDVSSFNPGSIRR